MGIGGFGVGWAFQFVGHAWEGRKPAFVDDVIGLVIGPLFVVALVVFACGFLPTLHQTVEKPWVGPPARPRKRDAPLTWRGEAGPSDSRAAGPSLTTRDDLR